MHGISGPLCLKCFWGRGQNRGKGGAIVTPNELVFFTRCMECQRRLAMRKVSVCLSVKSVHCDTRKSSDEIANVNFLYDDIVHALQNTIDSCMNSATDRRGCWNAGLSNSVKNAITPFKVIQGHQLWYQSKAHIRLTISD